MTDYIRTPEENFCDLIDFNFSPNYHEWQDMRFRVAKRYTNNLKNLPVVIPHVDEIVNHCYHKYVIRLENKETRDKLQKRLNANVHYPNPISENPMYKSILNRKDNC